MKKVIVLLAVAFAVSINAQANTTTPPQEENATVVATQDDGFVEVKFEELAEPVQAAIKAELKEGQTVKSVSQHKETKDLKVVVANADETEVTLTFDEAGKLKQ